MKAEIGATMTFTAAYKYIMKGSFFFSCCIQKAYIKELCILQFVTGFM